MTTSELEKEMISIRENRKALILLYSFFVVVVLIGISAMLALCYLVGILFK